MEIKIEDIAKEHIEYALYYIVHHGQRGRNDIFYLYHPMFNRGIVHEVNGKKVYVSVRETVRIAILYAMQKMPEEGVVSIEAVKSVSWVFNDLKANPRAFVIRLGFQVKIFSRDILEDDEPDSDEQNLDHNVMDKALSLLRQIGQIVFYGPPGTGKTFLAKKLLPSLLDVDADKVSKEKKRWGIVQFHPSYNYEDFVRGVKVETVDDNVVYKTVDSIFGVMCKRAKDDPNNDYVLIIDEINRANVSAVLGELIYALEYRNTSIKTPYNTGGKNDDEGFNLVVPKNLYIIGTMNTADRTIGQIDYAVRRRFAFVHCPPNENIIGNDARAVFAEVKAIFEEHISSDYDIADVQVGHSYFLPKPHENLADKIVYQVVPILREYVKDGILSKDANEAITTIRDNFSIEEELSVENNESERESANDLSEEDPKGHPFYYWKKDEGEQFGINGIGRTVLSITQDYVSQHPEKTIEEVQAWFPDRGKAASVRGVKLLSEIEEKNLDRFFTKEDECLDIRGQTAYVTREWNQSKAGKKIIGSLGDFIEGVKKSGYVVHPCYVVKINEMDKHLNWDVCKQFGFVSAGGLTEKGQSNTKGLKRIKEGNIVFAFLNKVLDGNRGFIGMGRVLREAVPIKEFKVQGTETSILDYELDGQKYRDKYSIMAEDEHDDEKCEWMLRVEWMPPLLSREDAEGTTFGGQPTYWWINKKGLKVIKRKFEGNK